MAEDALESQNVTVSLLSPNDFEKDDGARQGKWDILVRVAGPKNHYSGRPALQSVIYPEDYATPTKLAQVVCVTAGALAEELDLRMQAKRGDARLRDDRRGELASELDPHEVARHAGELFRDVMLTAREKGVM